MQQRRRGRGGNTQHRWHLGGAAFVLSLACALLTAVAQTAVVTPMAGAEDSAAAPVPSQPAEPVAAKAYGVFDQYCAGCHQAGRLKGLKQPAAWLGNILDLEALARDPAWVQPGNPFASPLYAAMQSRAMPIEAAGEASAPDITATELAAVRDWIEQMPPSQRCPERVRLRPAAIAEMVAGAVRQMEPVRAMTTRFISLAPLHNGCATAAEIESARQAVTLLVNTLSLALEPIKLAAVDPQGVVLELDLGLIGWDAERWDRLALRAPAATFTGFDAATRKAAGTGLMVVNGDWLADAASRAPLYYELLGMPESLPALLASLRLDGLEKRPGEVDRIGLRTSTVARGNRLIERQPFANGAAWFAQEFAPTAGRPDLFDLTIAAAGGATNGAPRPQPQPDATLMHFDLPNGFPAYFIANASGGRINDVPLSMLVDDAHPSGRFVAAQSCLGCHVASPVALARGRADDLRGRLATEPSLSKEARDKLLTLHSEPGDLQRKVDADLARFKRAAAAAGLDGARRTNGLEPLPALIARYRRGVTAAELADLVDLEPAALFELGKKGSAALADIVTRIELGAVPRFEIDAVMPEIAARRGLDGPGPIGASPAARTSDRATGRQLVLKTERATFQPGDLLSVTARPSFDCYLTLLTLDARGRATVLYPNEFDSANFLEAGHELRIPGDKAPFQFRLRDKGQETLIGICSNTAKPVDGIHHDFEKQRFTELGDYRAFLNRNWGNRDTGEAKPVRTRGARKPADAPVEIVKPDVQARAAIRIMIE